MSADFGHILRLEYGKTESHLFIKLDKVGHLDNRPFLAKPISLQKLNLLFMLPCSYSLGVKPFWRFGGKESLTHWVNELQKVFVEQPKLRGVS